MDSSPKPSVDKSRRLPPKRRLSLFLAVCALVLLVAGGVFGVKYLTSKPSDADDSAQIYKEVKQIMPFMLPSETPSVATITDVKKLNGQEFFRNAQTGDRVVVFSAAKIAMVYRQHGRAIINLGPISTSSAATSADTAK